MKASVKKIVFHPLVMAALGLLTGFLVKMMDIHFYTQHFGVSLSDIFSQAGVWVVVWKHSGRADQPPLSRQAA